jgi:hypothetical protein
MKKRGLFLVIGALLLLQFGVMADEGVSEVGQGVSVESKGEVIVLTKADLAKIMEQYNHSIEQKVEQKVEQKKVEVKSKKTYEFGYEMGWPFYGLSFKYWPSEHGIGFNLYQGSDYSYKQQTHLALRYYYNIKDDFYVSAGIGQYQDQRYDYDDNWDIYYYNYTETLLGIQFAMRTSEYSCYEFGYGWRQNSLGKSSGMVSCGLELHVGI